MGDVYLLQESIGALSDDLSLAMVVSVNEPSGPKNEIALVVADSMTNILREPRYLPKDVSRVARISMARNEFEAFQVVLVPLDSEIKNATWTVTDLRKDNGDGIPSSDISIQVMGYGESVKPAIQSEVDIWPIPILDFMTSVDVPRGEMQPLWVCVRTREGTMPGLYTGTFEVSADGCESKTMQVEVEVWDFAVPKEQHLLNVWGNKASAYQAIYGDRYDKEMARRIFDFLIEHRISVTTLYVHQASGKQAGAWSVAYPTLSDPKELKRLWDAGARWWNLGYYNSLNADRLKMDPEEHFKMFIDGIHEALRVADSAGWPHENMGIYLFDESSDFETVNKWALRVKKEFPAIPLMTTAYDTSFGVKDGPIDESMDIWCPLTPSYVENLETIQKGRELGKKSWWYVCCGPGNSDDLNFFCQFPAIRSRLLMGVATWKYKPDGFLYYRLSGWPKYDGPINEGPITNWKPYFVPDGDGELICPGPNGPLSTLQFENLRDGIEDYEYYWVLNDLIRRAQEAGLSVENESALLGVPGDLLESITVYSEDPSRLRTQRQRIAEAIVGLKARMR